VLVGLWVTWGEKEVVGDDEGHTVRYCAVVGRLVEAVCGEGVRDASKGWLDETVIDGVVEALCILISAVDEGRDREDCCANLQAPSIPSQTSLSTSRPSLPAPQTQSS